MTFSVPSRWSIAISVDEVRRSGPAGGCDGRNEARVTRRLSYQAGQPLDLLRDRSLAVPPQGGRQQSVYRLPPGQYYVVIDNTAQAGTALVANPLDPLEVAAHQPPCSTRRTANRRAPVEAPQPRPQAGRNGRSR